MEQELNQFSSKEESIAEKLSELERSNKVLSEDIAAEKNQSKSLNLNLEEAVSKSFTLKEELASKTTELEELHTVMKLSKNQLEVLCNSIIYFPYFCSMFFFCINTICVLKTMC